MKGKKVVIAVGVLAAGALALAGCATTGTEESSTPAPTTTVTVEEPAEPVAEAAECGNSTCEAEPVKDSLTPEEILEETEAILENAETVSQTEARESAESYIDTMPFSKNGLIDQLEYEGFSKADATYGVAMLIVNWKEQAALSAQSYLESSSFSRSGLIDQLEYEGFTKAQATFGVNQVGL